MNTDAPAGFVVSNLTKQLHCNGTYEKATEQVNGVAAYQQLEDPDNWLCFSVIHRGVNFDVTGMNPIIGNRFKKIDANYDLCQMAFDQLS